MANSKTVRKILRKRRVRAKIIGTLECPRLSVFRGLKTCTAQLINDDLGVTIAAATERELGKDAAKKTKTERAKLIGALIAQKAKAKGIVKVVFDRGGNAYHGRVQALADSAREGGLEF